MFPRIGFRKWASSLFKLQRTPTAAEIVSREAAARDGVRQRIERALSEGPFGLPPDQLFTEWVHLSEYQATLDVSLVDRSFLPAPLTLNSMRSPFVSNRGLVALFIPLTCGGDGTKKVSVADEPEIRTLHQIFMPASSARRELEAILKVAVQERLAVSKLPCTLKSLSLMDVRRVDAVGRWVDGVEVAVQLNVNVRALDVYEQLFRN